MREFIRGHLYKKEDDLIYLTSPKLSQDLKLIIPESYQFSFDSKLLNSSDYIFELVGKQIQTSF